MMGLPGERGAKELRVDAMIIGGKRGHEVGGGQ